MKNEKTASLSTTADHVNSELSEIMEFVDDMRGVSVTDEILQKLMKVKQMFAAVCAENGLSMTNAG